MFLSYIDFSIEKQLALKSVTFIELTLILFKVEVFKSYPSLRSSFLKLSLLFFINKYTQVSKVLFSYKGF